MNQNNMSTQNPNLASHRLSIPARLTPWLWTGAGLVTLALLFARVAFPELIWLTLVLCVLLLALLGCLVIQNQSSLRSRTTAYGVNSLVTIILVFGIVGVANFLGSRYPLKKDFTQNKLHTLSDQTVKVTRSLTSPLKVTYFGKIAEKEKARPLLDNYKALNPKFEVEYVDPDREPSRAKLAGIKKYGTVLLSFGTRESKVEDLSEEKLTNAMIKIVKDKSPTLCAVTGHGEKSFDSGDAEGYQAAKKALLEQAYQVRDVNIIQETKIPDTCDAVAVIGPTKSFLAPEAAALKDYLNNGGRAVFAIDVNLKGPEYSPELVSILEGWYAKPLNALVVDPLSRMFGVDASVAILANFNRSQAITKDFQANCVFPFTRPLEILPNAPSGLSVQWLAQTTPKSWAATDFRQIAKGEIQFNPGQDKQGPLNAALTIDGKQKDSKATRNTRLVVFGSSFFATNQVSRNAGNLDFFLNSVSWAMEDESLISIRAKEETPGKVELSQRAASAIGLLTILVIPALIAVAGVSIWVYRRKL
jgi:hypothetical protein